MFQTTNQHIIYVPAAWPQVNERCQEDGSTKWKSNAGLKHLTRVLPWENHGKPLSWCFQLTPNLIYVQSPLSICWLFQSKDSRFAGPSMSIIFKVTPPTKIGNRVAWLFCRVIPQITSVNQIRNAAQSAPATNWCQLRGRKKLTNVADP